MTDTLDEELLDAVSAVGSTPWSATTFRYTTARRDPLSGEGARLHGGRWNPPDLFPAIYLADPVRACMGELRKAARDNHLEVSDQLRVPYKLHTIAVTEVPVLDLCSEETRQVLGLELNDLTGPWETCQAVGHAAWFLEYAGVVAPSATTGGALTLALFEHRVAPGQVTLVESRDLTVDLYRDLSSSH